MPTMNDRIGGKDQLDLGLVIAAPTKDKEWFKKCFLIGLMVLIPIVGALNLSGWMRAYAEKRIKGEDPDTLPDANLNYIGGGWRLFLAFLPLVGILFLVMIAGGMAVGMIGYASSRHGGHDAEGPMIALILMMYGGLILFAIVMSIVQPAMMFLHIVEDEPWASVQFKRTWEVMKAGGAQYLLLFLAALIGGMIAQLGVIACYVGIFVSLPFGQAVIGAAIAEYARLTKPVDPSFPVEGGTGGSSGDPFGVKL
jgi:hypothetical protein